MPRSGGIAATAFTPRFKQQIAVHTMNEHVPEFHAWRCHGIGMRTSTAAMRAKMGYAGYSKFDMGDRETERQRWGVSA